MPKRPVTGWLSEKSESPKPMRNNCRPKSTLNWALGVSRFSSTYRMAVFTVVHGRPTGSCTSLTNFAVRAFAVLKALEDLVDRRQGLQLDIGFDLAADSEGEGFGHVLARADE
jgi:hypothetical protein